MTPHLTIRLSPRCLMLHLVALPDFKRHPPRPPLTVIPGLLPMCRLFLFRAHMMPTPMGRLIWRELSAFGKDLESHRVGRVLATQTLSIASIPILVISIRVADKINHLRRHYTPPNELDQALASLNQANSMLANTQHDLEVERRRSRDDLVVLQKKLDEANAQLSNSEFLAEKFKKTQTMSICRMPPWNVASHGLSAKSPTITPTSITRFSRSVLGLNVTPPMTWTTRTTSRDNVGLVVHGSNFGGVDFAC
ncbi:uncharacterized protein LOC111018304 [Momordica charantia]|uniref:Uncharacterized protein LOC111018304 n=1 Tax=Momordica charantia TaxID=3673 RepID=A0A6J1DA80_MOMCH|nr:uncharacterized protein LOC111018304 [Momordica charantia]